MTDTSDLWSAPNLVKAEVWLLGKCDLCGTGPLARTERDGPRVWHFHDQSSENARLAAQDRDSGPETPQGHPSEGTGVPGPEKPVQAADSYTAAELISRTLVLPFGTRHNRGHIREIAAHIDNEIRPVYYREAAASLRALGHDTAADILDNAAADLNTEETR